MVERGEDLTRGRAATEGGHDLTEMLRLRRLLAGLGGLAAMPALATGVLASCPPPIRIRRSKVHDPSDVKLAEAREDRASFCRALIALGAGPTALPPT